MFKKLMVKLEEFAEGRAACDPARFGDPVALQTEWSPARGGGANFCTRKLVKVGPDRVEFRAPWGARFFYLVFDRRRGCFRKGRTAFFLEQVAMDCRWSRPDIHERFLIHY